MKVLLFVLSAVLIVLIVSLGALHSSKSTIHQIVKLRAKRSFICLFGLVNVLERAVFVSLNNLRNQDPLEIGDSSDGSLQDGVFRGLSTLTNTSEFEVYCSQKNLIVFASTIGLKNADITYKWSCSFLFTIGGTVTVKMREINVQYELELNTTVAMDFEVKTLKVTKLEGFSVGFTGLGPLNPFIRGSMRLLHMFRSGATKEKLETHIKGALEEKLRVVGGSLNLYSLIQLFL